LLLLCLAAPARLPAQDEAQDSLAERVRRAEEALERLRRQIEEQERTKVQSRLRNRVELSGLILLNGFFNNAKLNNSDVPQFVDTLTPADTAGGRPVSALGGAVRQTRVALAVSGMRALGADLSGELMLDFFGGQQPSRGGRTHPLPRIRTAMLRLDWPHVGLLVGQESPLVAQLNPVSFASSGFPLFAGAGNLWLWIPQVRLTLETGYSFRAGIQGAALAPMSPDTQPQFETRPDSAERSRRPTAQGRVYIGWGFDETESQIGFGLHRGWIASGDSLLTSRALTVDWRLALGPKVLVLGEAFFDGQALAGLGGGGIGQNLGSGGAPVRTRGGWVQLNVRPSFAWELGVGYGQDDPDEADLPLTARGRNVAYTGHLHWRPGGGLLFGFEFRRLETTYQAGVAAGNHVNWFAGLAF
jgi:hypothetical protein